LKVAAVQRLLKSAEKEAMGDVRAIAAVKSTDRLSMFRLSSKVVGLDAGAGRCVKEYYANWKFSDTGKFPPIEIM